MKRKKMMNRRNKGDGCWHCVGKLPKNRLTKMRQEGKAEAGRGAGENQKIDKFRTAQVVGTGKG